MGKTKVAIIGSGNIGTDLMIKVMRLSKDLEMGAFVGIDPQSDGLQRAARMGVPITAEGIDGLIAMPEFAEIAIVFDATSAGAHKHHNAVLQVHGKRVIDLTLRDVTPRKLEMSQPGRLAVPVACLPARREDTLMTVVAMSHGELSRHDTLLRFERGELRIEDAAMLLGVCRRQVYRLLDRLRADGPEGLVSWKRGRPSNRAFKAELRNQVLGLVRQHYHDFGPTLATEYLAERHQVTISHETLRKLMIEVGIWQDRKARRPRPYQPRYRRDCRGELIQVDGSKHWWMENRGPQCTLLVYIDDATSELMQLKTEQIARKVYRSRNEAKADVFDYIECFYNPIRRHSTIGYRSPIDFEREAGVA